MPLFDDINRVFRDHVRFTGDGKPNPPAGAPLPTGDPRSGVHNPEKFDIRELLIQILQALGDPAALQEIIAQLALKADAANATKVFSSRSAFETAGQAAIEAGIGSVFTREGADLIVRGRTASATDPMFETGDRWGIVLRLPGMGTIDAAIAAAVAEVLAQVRMADLEALTLAALAEERAQAAEASAEMNAAAIRALLSRFAVLEAGATTEDMTTMTTYPLSLTAAAAPSVAIAAGPVQRLQMQNLGDTARVGISFGSPAASFSASIYIIEPGGAIDTPLIPATPIYVMTDGDSAPVGGAFAVPLNNPNPNWEADFQALMTRLGSGASLAYIEGYRKLYSSLRRDGILGRMRGLYVLAGHSQQAALVNWAADNAATIGGGTPVFTARQGVVFDGQSHLNSGVSMGALGVTTTTAAAAVWPGTEDQAVNIAAVGDGVFELHPNRAPNEVGSRGWAASTSVDVSASPGLGAFMGAVRAGQTDFTVYVGGSGEIETRDYISGYPSRPVFIGATNQSTGVGKRYTGLIRAAMFGLSVSAVQMMAANRAMTQFFKDIEVA